MCLDLLFSHFLNLLIPIQGHGGLLSQDTLGERQQDTLDRLSVHHRAYPYRQTHTCIPMGSLRISSHPDLHVPTIWKGT